MSSSRAARLAPKKYGDRISHDVHGSTTLNYQPAVLIKVSGNEREQFPDAISEGSLIDSASRIG